MIYNLSGTKKPPSASCLPFFIDANILYHFHVNSSRAQSPKIQDFSNYILNLKKNGNTLAVCSLNLQEVLHAIERFEYDTYCSLNDISKKTFTKKDYRKISAERVNVKNKLEIAYRQIRSNYELRDDVLSSSNLEFFISDFDKHFYEPVDYFSIYTRKAESFYYITDDNDFQSDPFLQTSDNIHIIAY
ncbi:MAG: hypothetical protein FWE54_06120 [Methanimicrococcus sp.]|nr:hypothetical protein [Methanimicrococcus sp.]